MPKTSHIILLAGLLLCAAPAVSAQTPAQTPAQTLHKDITVESKANPDYRDANRIPQLPELDLPPVKTPPLVFSDRAVTARVPNSLTTLPPAAWADPEADPGYKGYLRGGIFPFVYNAELAAGYRFKNTERTIFGISLDYAGDIYRRNETVHPYYHETGLFGTETRKVTWRDQSLGVALRLRKLTGKTGRFDLDLTYRLGSHSIYDGGIYSDYTPAVEVNTTHNPGLKLGYTGSVRGFSYKVGLRGDAFWFWDGDNADYVYLDPDMPVYPHKGNADQIRYGLNASGSLVTGEYSHIDLGIDLDAVRTDDFSSPLFPFDYGDWATVGSRTQTILDLNPRFTRRTHTTEVSIGARIDLAFNAGRFFNIAPDVTLAWTPMSIFGAQVKLGGGVTQNAIADIYHSLSPYLSRSFAYSPSRMPWTVEGLVTAGPFMNTSLELGAGYARARGWLMPVANDYARETAGTIFGSQKISGYYWRIALGYDDGRRFALKATYTGAPSSEFHAWHEYRDRARNVLDIDLTVRPIKPLYVKASWELRSGRSMYGYLSEADHLGIYPSYRVALGTVSDLSLTADWAYNDRLHFYVKGQNLLCRKWDYIGGRPARGIAGLIGASWRF